MRRSWLPLRSALIMVGAVLFATVVYDRLTRQTYLPDELAFLPPDSNVVIATGPVAELWHAIETQFGPVLREHERQGGLASLVSSIGSELERRNTPIRTLDDLAHYGWDVERGVLLGMQAAHTGVESIAIVPVSNSGSFLRFVVGEEEKPKTPDCTADLKGLPDIQQAGELFFAFPEVGLAVISNTCDRLVTALRHRVDQAEYLRNSDELMTAVRSLHGRPLLSGSGLFVWLRQLPLDVSGAGPVVYPAAGAQISLRIEPGAVRVEGEVKAGGGNATLLRRILAAPPAEQAWRDWLDPATPAVAVLRDEALAHYLDLASRLPRVQQAWPQALVPVLDEARRHADLHQIVLAATAYREGAPQMVLGIWGDRTELNQLVAEVQQRLRHERNRAVLEGALCRWHERQAGEADPTSCRWHERQAGEADPTSCRWRERQAGEADPTLADLNLVPESGALFTAYRIVDGCVIEPKVPPEASSTVYETTAGGIRYRASAVFKPGTVRYLAPAVTENDLLYRLPKQDLSEQYLAILRSNRFRLPALSTEAALWVATDEIDLHAMTARVRPDLTRADPERGGTIPASADPDAKLSIIINMLSLIEEGLFSGDDEIEKLVKWVLFDFRYHPQLTLKVTSAEDGETVRLVLEGSQSAGSGP